MAETDDAGFAAPDRPQCPVCDKFTDADAIASQQVILMGCKAMLEHDGQMVEDIFAGLTAYDAHVAISLVLLAMQDIASITGTPLATMIAKYQENLRNAQALEAGTTPPSDS